MLRQDFIEKIEDNPIIAAIKDDAGLEKSLETDIDVIFVLYGDVCSIPNIVKRIKDAGKTVVVHMDLINGLTSKEISLDFIKEHTEADGIITTKQNLIKHAKEHGLNTVLRHHRGSAGNTSSRVLREFTKDFKSPHHGEWSHQY